MALPNVAYAVPQGADGEASQPSTAADTGQDGAGEGEIATQNYEPQIAPASNEPRLSMGQVKMPTGLRISLAAAEPELANPVAFCFDAQGRMYVAETYRQSNLRGVEDNRSHMDWLDDDLAARTVDDRRAYLEKHLGDEIKQMTVHHDRIRQLRDEDGDKVYEQATVFADGFNDVLDGTGAGLLHVNDSLLFTCIPNLWRLQDLDDDGRAESREILHHGFGVRFAFRGHDLHGLIRGPDGRIYFSVGDRGYHIVTPNGELANPESGAVFRCEWDGSRLEVVATGLRNPQELAFNQWGDLFTGDNNSDSGDQARWVHVVEGSDSGWRMAYQYLPDRGPFNREKIWHPYHDGQPAYIVPPIANIADGPGGLVYYPGTGFPADWEDTFLLCDFRGTPGRSGIRQIRQHQQGSTYQLDSAEPLFWKVLATDCEFAPDGVLHILDWVSGWTGVGKGRVYRVTAPDAEDADAAERAAEFLTASSSALAEKEAEELIGLFDHPNMRVRLRAQFAAATRVEMVDALIRACDEDNPQQTRIHALWALGQLVRQPVEEGQQVLSLDDARRVLTALLSPALLADGNAEIRVQTARVLADLAALEETLQNPVAKMLGSLLNDKNPRVLAAAATGLGRIGAEGDLAALLATLKQNADRDPVLRHAVVMGLAGTQNAEQLVAAAEGASTPERMGLLLALRRQQSPLVAEFLADKSLALWEEAARAIYDLPIKDAMPALAEKLDQTYATSEPFLRRALAANYRLGDGESARRVTRVAANLKAPAELRIEALAMLEAWAEPSPRDWILGMWRPLAPREGGVATDALAAALPTLLNDRSEVRPRAILAASRLGVDGVGRLLLEIIADKDVSLENRRQAIAAMRSQDKGLAMDAATAAMTSEDSSLSAVGLELLADIAGTDALQALEHYLQRGDALEQRAAITALAGMNSPRVDQIFQKLLEDFEAGKVATEVKLDVLEGASQRSAEPVQQLLERIEQSLAEKPPLEALTMTLTGGDVARGEDIFLNKTAVSCSRCHATDPEITRVGPSLHDVGKRLKPAEILESIILPNSKMSEGFATTVLLLDTGQAVSGIIRSEEDGVIRLVNEENEETAINAEYVDERLPGKSAMPEDLRQHLSRAELRDLVAYLASLQAESVEEE